MQQQSGNATAREWAAARRIHLSGLAMVMIAAALWATVGVASRLLPHDLAIADEIYGFARTAVAGPVLLLCALAIGGAGRFGSLRSLRAGKDCIQAYLMFGASCAVFQIGLFRSFALLGVTITVFITVCLPPVIAIAWTWWRGRADVSRPVLAALLMAVAGLIAFSTTGFSGSGVHQALAGLGLSIAASVAFVLMSHAARGLASAGHAPVMVAGLGLTMSALFLAPAAVLFTPEGFSALILPLSEWRTGGFLLYLGLVPTALAYMLYCTGIARCRSAACGLVASMIEPAVAAGLAFLLLHELLSRWEILGCALLFLAMLTLWREEHLTG